MSGCSPLHVEKNKKNRKDQRPQVYLPVVNADGARAATRLEPVSSLVFRKSNTLRVYISGIHSKAIEFPEQRLTTLLEIVSRSGESCHCNNVQVVSVPYSSEGFHSNIAFDLAAHRSYVYLSNVCCFLQIQMDAEGRGRPAMQARYQNGSYKVGKNPRAWHYHRWDSREQQPSNVFNIVESKAAERPEQHLELCVEIDPRSGDSCSCIPINNLPPVSSTENISTAI